MEPQTAWALETSRYGLLMLLLHVNKIYISAYCIGAYCTGWMIMVISIGAGLCQPFSFNWDKTVQGGRCGNLDAAYISIAALDIVGDSMIIGHLNFLIHC